MRELISHLCNIRLLIPTWPQERNRVKLSTDLRHLAKNALRPIERKLRGVYSPPNIKSRNHSGNGGSSSEEREISTSNLVEMLIQEATDHGNLVCDHGLCFFFSLPGYLRWYCRPRCILDGVRGIERWKDVCNVVSYDLYDSVRRRSG